MADRPSRRRVLSGAIIGAAAAVAAQAGAAEARTIEGIAVQPHSAPPAEAVPTVAPPAGAHGDAAGFVAPDLTAVGVRPRGMVGRTRQYPATIDFADTDPNAWSVTGREGGAGEIRRSRAELCWGEAVAAVAYRGIGPDSAVSLRLREPVPLPEAFDSVELWMKGGVVGWAAENAGEPRILPVLGIVDAHGEEHRIALRPVTFPWWYVMYAPIDARTLQGPLRLAWLAFEGCSNTRQKTIYLDSISFFTLSAAHNLRMAPPDAGFVINEDTILPPASAAVGPTIPERFASGWRFIVGERQDRLEWRIDPRRGMLEGVTVHTADGAVITPCAGGGPVAPTRAWAVGSARLAGRLLIARFHASVGGAPITCRYGVRGRSLVVKVSGGGGDVERLSPGRLQGPGAMAHHVPYLSYSLSPAAPRIGTCAGRFISVLPCWYASGASELFVSPAAPRAPGVMLAGEILYRALPRGRRRPLEERLVVTVADRFADALPAIPHAPAPHREGLRERLHCHTSRRVTELEADLEAFRALKSLGVDKLLVRHHSQVWADDDQGPQEWTLTEHAAPVVGDARLRRYLDAMRELDYLPVLYSNYCDIQPVSPQFDYDRILREPGGSIRHSCWPGSYPLKPIVGAQLEDAYAPRIRRRFGVRGSFLDVHTALAPWDRTDYDSRSPGAGTFQTAYRATANTLLGDRRHYDGPIIGEGTFRMFYAGLMDGNDAELAECWNAPWQRPWLVDFDLLRLHPLEAGCGMSTPPRFVPPEEIASIYDPHGVGLSRYLAATLAFGHAGHLPSQGGGAPYPAGVRAYHLVQPIQSRYLLAKAVQILYFDGVRLIDTESAILTGAVQRSQVEVRYDSGLTLAVNGSPSDHWSAEVGGASRRLPPFGFAASAPDLTAFSAEVAGQRMDYVRTPSTLFFDPWGAAAEHEEIASDGAAYIQREGDSLRVIPLGPVSRLALRPDALAAHPAARWVAVAEPAPGARTEPVPTHRDGDRLHLPVRPDRFAFTLRPVG